MFRYKPVLAAIASTIVASLANAKPLYVEVKWTRNNPATLSQLRHWSAQMAVYARAVDRAQIVLMVSSFCSGSSSVLAGTGVRHHGLGPR